MILGGFFGEVLGGWYPQTMSKYLSLKHLLMSKKMAPWLSHSKD